MVASDGPHLGIAAALQYGANHDVYRYGLKTAVSAHSLIWLVASLEAEHKVCPIRGEC